MKQIRDRSSGKFQRQHNLYDLSGDYAIGYTLKGEQFWFDKEDYDLVYQYCWYYSSKGYVQTTISGKCVKLHRLIMGITDKNIQVDHINHPPRHEHKVDNRKSNLRVVDNSKNCQNRSIASNNTSGVVGVHWSKLEQKWKAYIKINQEQIHLGTFNNKDDAIRARKNAEIKYFGEYRYDANNQGGDIVC